MSLQSAAWDMLHAVEAADAAGELADNIGGELIDALRAELDKPLEAKAEVGELERERDEWKDKAMRMLRGDIAQMCSYCGWETPAGGGSWEDLQNHIKACPEHPLRSAEAEIKRLKRMITHGEWAALSQTDYDNLVRDAMKWRSNDEERAWLIERRQDVSGEPPRYWAGGDFLGWTTDINDAIRFARREDALRVHDRHKGPILGYCNVVEHLWIDERHKEYSQ